MSISMLVKSRLVICLGSIFQHEKTIAIWLKMIIKHKCMYEVKPTKSKLDYTATKS